MNHIKYLFAILLAMLCVQLSHAQKYIYPIKNVKGLQSASFAELRTDHFHSGIDIRTERVEGKPVVAVADGYISRIAQSPYGFGLALYVTHPQHGTMSVYAHLSRFRDDIAGRVLRERYASRKNSINILPSAADFPVKQGDTIAWSGNSGSSGGPHLHFELRNTKGTRTLNLASRGLFRAKDNIAPQMLRLHYVGIDSVSGVAVERVRRTYELKRNENGTYAPIEWVRIGKLGYFVVEVCDRRNDVSNRFGIYRLSEYIDGCKVFEYRMDGFDFADTRYCNAVSYYPLQREAKCEVLRLAQLELSPDKFYTAMVDRGTITSSAECPKRVRIEAEDDCGNISVLEFKARAEVEPAPVAECDNSLSLLSCRRKHIVGFEDVTLTVPAGALYESVFGGVRRADGVVPTDSALVVLSPAYALVDERVPLHTKVTVDIRAEVPENLRGHACIAAVGKNGRLSSLGGSWSEGRVSAKINRFCTVMVIADTVAPRVRPCWSGRADMRTAGELAFEVVDNFSGVGSCELFIDGEWRTLESRRGRFSHHFDAPLPSADSVHTATLRVKDGAGNETVWRGEFVR